MHKAVEEKKQMTERKDEGKTRRLEEKTKCSVPVVVYYSYLGEECPEVILRPDSTRGH
jgi:hypothetical protein